jgi:hypothetical protein
MPTNADYLENVDCPDCPAVTAEPSAPACSTTTWAVTTSSCSGTVSVATLDTLEVCCDAIGIPAIESAVCAECPCLFESVEITALPTKGTLTLLGVAVEVGDMLTRQSNGLLTYEPTTAGTADTDTFTATVHYSCGTANTTVTISILEATCESPSPCTNC